MSKLIKDNQHNIDEVNTKLDKMGYNIGTRIIDEFWAKQSQRGVCKSFRETAEVIAKEAFKMFLGITAEVSAVPQTEETPQLQQFSLILRENPLADFVVLPPQYQNSLWYSNLLCGVIRGSLDMLNMKINCFFV